MITALIERAVSDDQPALFRLLDENHLPVAGLEQHFATALVARDAGQVVGAAALEVYADGALLRSVAVAPGLQRNGIGHQLTEAALQLAKRIHVPAVYLLTNTAPDFFPKFGFERIARSDPGNCSALARVHVGLFCVCAGDAKDAIGLSRAPPGFAWRHIQLGAEAPGTNARSVEYAAHRLHDLEVEIVFSAGRRTENDESLRVQLFRRVPRGLVQGRG